jgi:hypothetical protein
MSRTFLHLQPAGLQPLVGCLCFRCFRAERCAAAFCLCHRCCSVLLLQLQRRQGFSGSLLT